MQPAVAIVVSRDQDPAPLLADKLHEDPTTSPTPDTAWKATPPPPERLSMEPTVAAEVSRDQDPTPSLADELHEDLERFPTRALNGYRRKFRVPDSAPPADGRLYRRNFIAFRLHTSCVPGGRYVRRT